MIGCPIGTVCPSLTSTFSTTPDSYASSSIVALSVSISRRISPFLTSSPGCLSHLAIVPSVIVSDSRGVVTSATRHPRKRRTGPQRSAWNNQTAAPTRPAGGRDGRLDRVHQVLGRGQRRELHHLRVRQGDLGRCDPPDRRIQVVERVLLDRGCHLGADAVGAPVLLEDHRPVRLLDGLDDRLAIEGPQGA